jgi:large subunit ribosomal protein L10
VLRSEKRDFVQKLEDIYASSNSMVVVHYHGLSVSSLTKLRKALRANGVGFQVTKNTLSKIALNNEKLSSVASLFKGPTAVAYSEDPIAAAKGIMEFAKANDNLKIMGGMVDGCVLDVDGVSRLASLPSIDELRAKILGLLQAPAGKLLGTIQAPLSSVARVIGAYAKK